MTALKLVFKLASSIPDLVRSCMHNTSIANLQAFSPIPEGYCRGAFLKLLQPALRTKLGLNAFDAIYVCAN
jgi:hypothetical protein